MAPIRRRDFITGVSVATLPAVAGCSGNDTDSNNDGGGSGTDEQNDDGGGSGTDEQNDDGGGSGPDEDSGSPGGPLQVLERYWSTWENQNADAYQDLYHSDSPERQKDYWNDDGFWANFGPREGVDWTIEDRELLESTEARATVREVYIWRESNQPTIRVTDWYELRTENGDWKIWTFTDQEIEELEGEDSDSDEQQEDIGSAEFETDIEHADTMIVGEMETVSVSVENVGDEAGNSEIMFKLHTVEETKEIALDPGQSKELAFEFEVPNNPGEYNLRVATVAAEEVLRAQIRIAELENVYDIVLERNGFECTPQPSSYAETIDWEVEVSAAVDLDRGGDLSLRIAFLDSAGRLVGAADIFGTPPTPAIPVVWGIENTDLDNEECGDAVNWDQPCCEYVTRIDESLNDGGTIQISEARFV